MVALPHSTSLLGRRGRLALDELLASLVVDGYLLAEDAKQVRMGARSGRTTVELHPLVVIANAKLPNQRVPGRPLSLEGLTEWLAAQSGLPYLKIDPMKINAAAVTQVVSHGYAQRHRILPVDAAAGEVTFATCEPFDAAWATDLAHMLRRDVRRVVANPLDINRYLLEFYGVQRSIQLAQDTKTTGYDSSAILNFEQLVELGKNGEVGADDRHVVHIVDWLLQYAFEQRASDIHLEPRREAGQMDVAEKRRPQDGRIKTRSSTGREVELRISSMPTAFGEKMVMRIFDPDIVAKDFSQLGFSSEEDARWRSMVERPHGIVLVTGPTGSGKTTTLYSTLKHLATPAINVCTVEDPIEMVSPEFNQMQVQPAIDLDFATGVRTLLRQDPDIIMIGEIRDLETAQMAVQASLTGHLVLSTLHTNDAPSAVTRLLDLGVPHYLSQSTLTGVVAQRLVRTLCAHCKHATEQDPHEWVALTHGWSLPVPEQVFKPVGCLECRHTGFMGRTGIYEMMQLSPRLRGLISSQLDLGNFGTAALAEGLCPLRISAATQVARGLTTVKEVLMVLPPIEAISEDAV
ncbi:GspE/PulE family protein [Dyella silvatica]|uniref:GspE/PulE family protein n=1 Tax=Dyella silvatica TaxID=2992128 RepID=UPI00225B8F07|nr:GspE/PulE family protein [Dyella silvatica]